MRKILFLLLSGFLVLAACANEKNDNKNVSKTVTKDKDSKEKKNKDKKNEKNSKKEATEEQSNSGNSETEKNTDTDESESGSTEQVAEQKIPQVDLGNITDRNTLESVINGNYSEEEKVQAYNSAVANGIIPQGNVMEGPASAAYQSSLRVESGAENSVYEQSDDNTSENESEVASESDPSSPRSLREIKEQTGRGASEFTPEEKVEAQAYADQH